MLVCILQLDIESISIEHLSVINIHEKYKSKMHVKKLSKIKYNRNYFYTNKVKITIRYFI